MRDSGGFVVEDFSGNNHFGLLTGKAFFKNDPVMRSTVTISGNDGLIAVRHNVELEPAQGTVTTWIKVDVLKNADIFNKLSSRLVRTGTDVSMSVYGMHANEDGSVSGFVLNDDPATPGLPWACVSSQPGLLQVGKWQMLALRWDNQELAIFLDGQLLVSAKYRQVPVLGLSYSGESDFSLGQSTYWGGWDHGFLGQFGETSIYSRALQNKELRDQYAAKKVTN
jgi:Concanavalin A-like lectin/glucanases superfamily